MMGMAPATASPAEWMTGLRDRALEWVRGQQPAGETEAYAGLILAFGLAEAGAQEDAADGLANATLRLDATGDEIHRLLAASFRYRIEEALAGREHHGPLPGDMIGAVGLLGLLERYVVDRLRKQLR